MDILTIIAAVFRRWYVTVPIVLASLGTAYYIDSTLPPQYEARGQVLLASPDLDPAGLPRTVVNLGEIAGEAATIQAQDQMIEGNAELTVTARIRALTVDVEGSSVDVVEATYANAVAWLGEAVAQRQDDAEINPEEQLVLQQAGEVAAREVDEGRFQISTSLELVDPAAAAPNPFGANSATARILIVSIQSDAGRMRVAERAGPGVGFTVSQDARDAAPIIEITTVGADPQRVLESYHHVADVIEADLAEREARAEVPETHRTRTERIAEPRTVTDTSPPLDRSVAAIVGLGAILAVMASVMWDGVATRRRERTSEGEARDRLGRDDDSRFGPASQQESGVARPANPRALDPAADDPEGGPDRPRGSRGSHTSEPAEFFGAGSTSAGNHD